jgi:hypothetical protein
LNAGDIVVSIALFVGRHDENYPIGRYAYVVSTANFDPVAMLGSQSKGSKNHHKFRSYGPAAATFTMVTTRSSRASVTWTIMSMGH